MANPIFTDSELANIAKLNAMDKANQSNYDANAPVTPSSYWSSPVNSATPTYGGSGGSTPNASSPAQYQYNPQALAQAAADAARQRAEQEAAAKKQQYIDAQTGLYNNYFSQQQNSQLAALKNARDTALQGFNNSERVAQQNAYNNKNQVDIQGVQAAQKLREIMASQGLMSSGDNITANVQLQNQRDSSLNDINQATGNVLQDVAEKRNLAYNQEASQEQSLIDKLSGDKTAALIDLNKYGDQKETDLHKFNYQQYIDTLNNAFRQQQADIGNKMNEAQLTGQYNGKDTLSALNAARQDALARAGLMGTLDGQQTLASQGQQFGQMATMAGLTGYLPNGIQTLAAQQADRNFNLQNKSLNFDNYWKGVNAYGYGAPKDSGAEFAQQYEGAQTLPFQQLQQNKDQFNAKLNQDNAQFTAKLRQDASQLAAQMGYNYAKLNQDQQQALMQQAYQNSQLGLAQQKFGWEKDPTNPQNILANENKQSLIDNRTASRLKGITDEIDSSPYIAKSLDDYGKPTGGVKVVDQMGLEKYILSQSLSDTEARKLYARYGLKWGG